MAKDTLKKVIGILTMAILLITTNSFTNSNAVHASESETPKKTISVNGEYSIKVAPDIAYIDIAVNTFNEDPKKAQDLNKMNMNKVMEQLKELGIEDKDIRTIDYRIQRQPITPLSIVAISKPAIYPSGWESCNKPYTRPRILGSK